MTPLKGSASLHRVTQIPNGLRKYPMGDATRDSSFLFQVIIQQNIAYKVINLIKLNKTL